MIVDSVVLVLATFSDLLTRLGYDPGLWWSAHFDPAIAGRLFGYYRPRFVSVPARTWYRGRWHRVSVLGVIDESNHDRLHMIVSPYGNGFAVSRPAIDYMTGLGVDEKIANFVVKFVQHRNRLMNVQVTAKHMDRKLRFGVQKSIRAKVSFLNVIAESVVAKPVAGDLRMAVRP
ncbi:MAG: hypothetical protein DRP47_10010 [Candidatus Zixiibacteriota bacterium]|nr:MAG: hypothetical protein DRP47_10010 [candidate division Zixibacteria bacterium]